MNGANPNDIVASQVSVDSTWKNVFLTDKFGTLKKANTSRDKLFCEFYMNI